MGSDFASPGISEKPGENMNQNASISELDHRRTFCFFSFLAGLLSILLLVITVKTMPSAAHQLSSQAGGRAGLIVSAIVILTWAVFSTPFVVGLGGLLRTRGAILAQAAMILSAAGILLLGFGVFAQIGALLSIAAASGPSVSADASYQVAIWTSLGYYLTDPGLMTWGLGQFLFGWLAWKSRILPNGLSILGMIAGIAGLLTLAVYQTPTLALVQLAGFAVWGIGAGIRLALVRQRPHIPSAGC